MNSFKSIMKFITVFISVTGVLLYSYYSFTTTPFERLYRTLEPGQNQAICKIENAGDSYSLCTRRYIKTMLEKASPLECTYILPLVERIYKQDQELKLTLKKSLLDAYTKNVVTFLEGLQGYEIKRNQVDFFQIIIKPILKYKIRDQIKRVQDYLKSQPDRTKEIQKILSVKINF